MDATLVTEMFLFVAKLGLGLFKKETCHGLKGNI